MSRPEHIAPPEIFYGETEATKYTENSRIAAIQAEMAYRALELLNLPEDEPAYLLDIGCGSGLSGEILQDEGHIWVGMDIAPSMLVPNVTGIFVLVKLDVAKERDVEGDLFLQDAGQGMAFRPGTFDGAISISVLQWLCNADKQINNPKARIARFFSTLYSSLRRGARAVFQFYPENDDQIQMLTDTASKCGFEGGLLVDYPNSKKAKKYYLCLFAGQGEGVRNKMPQALGEDGSEHPAVASVEFEKRRIKERRRSDKRRSVKDKKWILHKKETMRSRGDRAVVADSKYTGRKRKPRF